MKISFFAGIFLFTIFLTTGSTWANAEICGATGEKAAEFESKGDLTTAVWCYTNHKNWQAAVALQNTRSCAATPGPPITRATTKVFTAAKCRGNNL